MATAMPRAHTMRSPDCLNPLEVAHVGPVLGDSVDKLSIIGHLMPHGPSGRGRDGGGKGAAVRADDDMAAIGIDRVVRGQESLDTQFQRVMELKNTHMLDQPENRDSFISELRSLATSLHGIGKAPVARLDDRADPSSKENLIKLHRHRAEIQAILEALLEELKATGDYQSLVKMSETAAKEKTAEDFLLDNETTSKNYLESLRRDEVLLQLQAEADLGDVNSKIALFKDRIQERKAKTATEEQYLKEQRGEFVKTSSDKQENRVKQLKEQISLYQKDIETLAENHQATIKFLKGQYEELSAKLLHWSNKYDEETMEMQERVDALREKKESDLQALHTMTEKYKEYEVIVEEDRLAKEELRRQHEQEVLEKFAVTKIQSWWKGMLVRHQLGPYSKKKKKKGKGSGKKKKGKGKGKGKKKKK